MDCCMDNRWKLNVKSEVDKLNRKNLCKERGGLRLF